MNPFRAEAINLHKTRYFTGEMCKRGHVAYRNTANGSCVICVALETKTRRATVVGHIRRTLSKSKSDAKKHGGLSINPVTIHPYPGDNRCELCGQLPKERRLHADHCHHTGMFRGWLCYRCNSMLGNMAQVGPGRITEYIQGLEYGDTFFQ